MRRFATLSAALAATLAAGFFAGAWFSYSFGVGPERVVVRNSAGTPPVQGVDLSVLREVSRLVRENFAGADSMSGSALAYGVARGYVDALGDKHTQFFDPDEAKKFEEALSGDFEGIGAYVDRADFGVYVDQVIAGSPAKEAGVLSGDVILKAGGAELKGLTLADAIKKIRGPDGTWVELEILRAGRKGSLVLKVQRRKITIPSVELKFLTGSSDALVSLASFGERSADEFHDALSRAYEKGAKGLIVDLRDNGGGYLDAAVKILSDFVEKGRTVVSVKSADGSEKKYLSSGGTWPEIPVVVLANGNSASASEITAGALKEYGVAVLVGEKTYGKGSVQQPYDLDDGSEVKITVAHWYTPDGNLIDGKGIEPDVAVKPLPEDFDKKYDRQLEAAKQVLSAFEKGGIAAARAWRPKSE